MTRCYIALGSNLGNPKTQIKRAITALADIASSNLISVSPLYQTKAIGPGAQPDYINAAACLDTQLTAHELLNTLQQIELDQHRERLQRWGARTLDLDLLLYGNQTITDDSLQIPHPRIKERAFVLYPLFDIAPSLLFPDGALLRTVLNCCSNDDICRLDDATSNGIM